MKTRHIFIPLLTGMFLLGAATDVRSQADADGCNDYPLFTRMPDFYIRVCEGSDFDTHEFSSETGAISVQGKTTILNYVLKDGAQGPSAVAITQNYINAIKKVGGTLVYDGGGRATLKMTKGNQEIWIGINILGVNGSAVYEYRLDVAEKGAMQQEVHATAAEMVNDIITTGRAALYGIYFDTGSSEIKPESRPALKEIAKMLKQDATMKLFVVGHTDNVGGIAGNLTLSKARAESVVKELTTKDEIAAGRLAAHGVGSLSPVAPNTTEAGRALNRRVELVVQ